jgi:hypothetical protein
MSTKQKTKWWIDAALFTGFIVAFFLDLTGVGLHQWIGVLGGVLAAYHLITHWDWVKAVSRRLKEPTASRAQLYYMFDAVILFGFAAMIGTGVLISTWLNLALANYAGWRAVHIIASVITLLFVVVKLGLHWRWIVSTAQNAFARPVTAGRLAIPGGRQTLAPQAIPVQAGGVRRRMGRREFLGMMSVTGIASLLAVNSAMHGLASQASAQTVAYTDSSAQASTAANSTSTTGAGDTTSSSCTVRCNRGCSYPGGCRRYTDSNNNNRCDFGECL